MIFNINYRNIAFLKNYSNVKYDFEKTKLELNYINFNI